MRLIHTSDWHLGQSLHGQSRDYEHRCFLDWLLSQLTAHQADALLIAGDIFDNLNPSLQAQELLYDFILKAHQQLPQLHMVMIAGNHDSGARIELPAPLMQRLNTHAIGRIHWQQGILDQQRLLIPLPDKTGEIAAWCLALPFLRPSEITGKHWGSEYLPAVTQLHHTLVATAEQQRQPHQALLAMSHAHLVGGLISEDSERSLIIGNTEALPAQLFPDSLSYVALGHLHRPQKVSAENRIRYSGSPIPLSFAEVNYPHQVLLVELEGPQLTQVEPLEVPRAVPMLRLGPAPLEELLPQIKALPAHEGTLETAPWLEVRVQLQAPRPDLRHALEQALEDKKHRLIRINPVYKSPTHSESCAPPPKLEHIPPQKLFELEWQKKYSTPPSQEVLNDFAALLQRIHMEEESTS